MWFDNLFLIFAAPAASAILCAIAAQALWRRGWQLTVCSAISLAGVAGIVVIYESFNGPGFMGGFEQFLFGLSILVGPARGLVSGVVIAAVRSRRSRVL
jgi:hypothetical protein